MEAGRSQRHAAKLIKHFGVKPLDEIGQAAIDEAAIALFPAGTRNAGVYTPVSAILHHANVDLKLRRPKGAKGRVVTDWLRPEDARGIIQVADGFDAQFGLLLRFLLYSGLRLGEVLALRWSDIDLETGTAWVRRKKDGIASDVRMRVDLRDRIAAHGPREPHGRVFRFHQGGDLKHKLTRAKLAYLELPCPALPCPAAGRLAPARQSSGLGEFPYLPSHVRDLDAPGRHRCSRPGGDGQLARCEVRCALRSRGAARRVAAGRRPTQRGKDVESVMSDRQVIDLKKGALLFPGAGRTFFGRRVDGT
jgi:hypothetical protein